MTGLLRFNMILGIVFALCYAYQVVYIFFTLFGRGKPHGKTELHRFAVLVCAHNEENVIGALLDSLGKQDYPHDLFDVYVGADNCTDATAAVSEAQGARVFERKDTQRIGKGYVLDFLLGKIVEERGEGYYDAYVVFDADNLASGKFLTELNKTFSDGYEIVTGYRNAKNYGAGWVAAGSGLWFIREARYLNGARRVIGSGGFLAGTGFCFSEKIRKMNGGWPFHTLTEDCEFVVAMALRDQFVGYAPDAMFYDEQTPSFVMSFHQRLRWCRGGLQVFRRYFAKLVRRIFSRRPLTFYDLSMSAAPAYVLSATAIVGNVAGFVCSVFSGEVIPCLLLFAKSLAIVYVFVLFFSLLATVTEWKKIRASAAKKVLYAFTFPFYMMTFAPIAFLAFFVKAGWKPIRHSGGEKIEQMEKTE